MGGAESLAAGLPLPMPPASALCVHPNSTALLLKLKRALELYSIYRSLIFVMHTPSVLNYNLFDFSNTKFNRVFKRSLLLIKQSK